MMAGCWRLHSELFQPRPGTAVCSAILVTRRRPSAGLSATLTWPCHSCSGDHTVKIVDVRTGTCLRSLSGHRRTPWVVSRATPCVDIAPLRSCSAAAPDDCSSPVCISAPCLLQVRFHPTNSNLVASGSLDYQVRLWDVSTGQCINHHDFGASQCALPHACCLAAADLPARDALC